MPDGWPAFLPGLGPKVVGAYAPCAACALVPEEVMQTETLMDGTEVSWPVELVEHTWVAYGDRPLCLAHVKAQLAQALIRSLAPFGPTAWTLVAWPRRPGPERCGPELWPVRPPGVLPRDGTDDANHENISD
jgi:hypothetical protein